MQKNADPAGSWTFEGGVYDAASCTGSISILNASNINNDNAYTYGTITCNFYHAFPTAAGTFHVVPYPALAANQMSVAITTDGGVVNYIPATSNTGIVNVKVASNGFLSVSGSGILMINTSGGSDSSMLTVNLNQTQ